MAYFGAMLGFRPISDLPISASAPFPAPVAALATLCVADLYFSPAGSFYDLSNSSNRYRFHQSGAPVGLGNQASVPLGAPSPIFLSSQTGTGNDLATNYGTAGAFTIISGPLNVCGGGNPLLGIQPATPVNRLIMWDQHNWWTGSQESTLIFIGSQEALGTFTMYGTNGNSIFPICQNTSASLPKTLVSKLWMDPGGLEATKNATRFWTVSKTVSSVPPVLTVSADNESASVTQVTSQPSSTNIGYWQYVYSVSNAGYMSGLTIQTTEPDIVFVAAALGVQLYTYRL